MTLYRALTLNGPVDNTLSDSATGAVLKGWTMGYAVTGWQQTSERELLQERK